MICASVVGVELLLFAGAAQVALSLPACTAALAALRLLVSLRHPRPLLATRDAAAANHPTRPAANTLVGRYLGVARVSTLHLPLAVAAAAPHDFAQ